MTLFNLLRLGLTIPGFDAIIMVRNGAVYVDGVQRTDPVFQIFKPCAIHAGGQRLWVSPIVERKSHEQKSIS